MARGRHIRRNPLRRRQVKRSSSALLSGMIAVALLGATALATHDGASTVVDLTTFDATATFGDGVRVVQTSFDESTGTGIFDSFVRLQANGTERGYNTSGALEFDEKGSGFTRDLILGEVPVTDDGFREFRLDVNQTTPDSLLTLDRVRIFVHDEANFSGASVDAADFGITGALLVWEMESDHQILLDYGLAPGSGKGDMFLYIPVALFDAATGGCGGNNCFVTLYSEFGDGNDSNDGFEEWSVRKQASEVVASKTADTGFTRTFPWTIDKTVVPATWDLFEGDTGTSEYTVSVEKGEAVDSDFFVTGSLVFLNQTTGVVRVTAVSDTVSAGIAADVVCPVALNTAAADVGAGESLVCTYSADLPDATERLNSVDFSYREVNPMSGNPAGATLHVLADELVQFDLTTPTIVVNDEINVTDSVEGDLGTFTGTDSAVYDHTFECDDDEGTHPNTATIDETGQSDDASVTVTCYALEVTKDADTALTRTWTWDIDKAANETELLLSEGQLFEVHYDVTVSATSLDSDHAVEGGITVTNPAPVEASLTGVTDLVSPDIAATVECPSLTVPAAGSLDCTYSADLPDDATRTNTATATLQNNDYDKDGLATPSGTTDFTGDASVDFTTATVSEVDECVNVEDDNVGTVGTVCAGDLDAEGEYLFTYSLWFGAHPDADVVLECGENSHPNVASFETNDTSTPGSDDETVAAVVECIQGCTLTPGYWKTHNDSFWGGAPVDDTWLQIMPSAEDSPFFLSGMAYFEVLWTAPKGNVYYNLAFHYIAAELNQLNGADIPADVLDAFNDATALFEAHTPEEIAALKGKPSDKALRQEFITLAGILGEYNEGDLGPGHCSEDAHSG